MGYIEAMNTPVTTMPEFTLRQWSEIKFALRRFAGTQADESLAATQPKKSEFYWDRYEELLALTNVIEEVIEQLREQTLWG